MIDIRTHGRLNMHALTSEVCSDAWRMHMLPCLFVAHACRSLFTEFIYN